MSISMDESKLDQKQHVASNSVLGEHHHQKPWEESILTNSFDDQIKLVENSISTVKSRTTKDKRKNKKTTDCKKTNNNTLQDTDNPHNQQQKKHMYTNRSRIYRFDPKEQVSIVTTPTIFDADSLQPPPLPPPLHPPTKTDLELILDMPKNEADARASMLMSWYTAGYRTGYYDAMKRFKQDYD